jgi:hypothetical protein
MEEVPTNFLIDAALLRIIINGIKSPDFKIISSEYISWTFHMFDFIFLSIK